MHIDPSADPLKPQDNNRKWLRNHSFSNNRKKSTRPSSGNISIKPLTLNIPTVNIKVEMAAGVDIPTI